MTFTALHRALGVPPGPLTEELLDAAIEDGVTETSDLDWKGELPPTKNVQQTDFPKDVAAMANSGGGVIVFGVREAEKAATERTDTGELTEIHERTLRAAAITAISPPVFGLTFHRIGPEGNRVITLEVPSSIDGPHLIYRGEYFGAPIRNDADTVWMKERQIESMYRARFNERRNATQAMESLYSETRSGRDISQRAWLVAVGHPRIPSIRERLSRDQAREVMSDTERLTLTFAGSHGIHPIASVDRLNPRPGLRRWVAANTATDERARWKESWLSIHHDGSVTIAAAIGGHRVQNGFLKGHQIESKAIECAVADFMALVRSVASKTGSEEYDVRVGIEWSGDEPLTIVMDDGYGFVHDLSSTPLHQFVPVDSTIDASESDLDYFWHVHDLAEDCINQGGVSNVSMIRPPARDDNN